MKNLAYVFLADGFEEIEAICPADVLRRSTKDVNLVSISDSLTVTSAHGVNIVADMTLDAFLKQWNEAASSMDPAKCLLVFPGGIPGAVNLATCGPLMSVAAAHFSKGGLLGAICAAPGTVLPVIDGLLQEKGLPGIAGRKFTCYPGCEPAPLELGAVHEPLPCVTDANLVTANGPGAAMEFAYALASLFISEGAVETLRRGMMYH
ncbi:MAG: DJ-1/PfpI family protein [Bacteroidales bacterium]|nr:DJ-1/PfpI family protein [Bacteroidales bacterium]MCR4565373.1 DJ-1/PfpI family protein [Bacteroidales bacterium]